MICSTWFFCESVELKCKPHDVGARQESKIKENGNKRLHIYCRKCGLIFVIITLSFIKMQYIHTVCITVLHNWKTDNTVLID